MKPVLPKADVTGLRRKLLAWYRREARTLPWRGTKDPYSVWLSEVIFQQTRIEQGTPYFERFIARFPTVQSLADAREDDVLKLWEGLGYYSRARNLHRASKIIAYERHGRFPSSAAEWLEIPGVGRYTAGAIASIAYSERTPVVDGNVIRVLTRLHDIDTPADSSGTIETLWRLAGDLVPVRNPGDFNQALMELGSNVCTPRAPVCGDCPVASHCKARARGVQLERPVRREKKPPPHYDMVAAVIVSEGKYFIAKRPPNGLLGGLWEFPGNQVVSGENHSIALRRTGRDLLGVTLRPGRLVACVSHAYSHFRVTVNAYRCFVSKGQPSPCWHTESRWVSPDEFAHFAFPKANLKILPMLTNER
ncbi:MAG: A/G-specific adenine glycosylase [Candidatus Hydrogenedentota bacterium]